MLQNLCKHCIEKAGRVGALRVPFMNRAAIHRKPQPRSLLVGIGVGFGTPTVPSDPLRQLIQRSLLLKVSPLVLSVGLVVLNFVHYPFRDSREMNDLSRNGVFSS